MKDELIFWAQALDNVSPDHFFQGQLLDTNSTEERQYVATQIASVGKHGRCDFDDANVRLTTFRNQFVLEFPTNQRDEAGRIAQIVCCGRYTYLSSDLGDIVWSSSCEFASKINRTVSAEYKDIIARAFVRSRQKKMKKLALGAGLIIGSIIFAYWITSKN